MGNGNAENITPHHLKAARALIDWSAQDLANNASVGISTIKVFESGKKVRASSLQAIIDGLEAARITRDGVTYRVELLNGGEPGARLRKVKS